MPKPVLLQCYILYIYVTGFAKRGLPHTYKLPTSTIHIITHVKTIDLKFLK